MARHRLVTEAVHAAGGLICMQILHTGRYAYHPFPVAPSAIRAPINRFKPRELSSDGVRDQIADFVNCAQLARDAGLPMILGCAGTLPIKPRSVDIVVLSQVAHHLHGDAVIRMARELTRVARVGVVLADLRRSRLAMIGFWFGSRMLRFDPATRADGLTSVRRSYTRMELKTLLSRAGLDAKVEQRPGFRLVATWRSV